MARWVSAKLGLRALWVDVTEARQESDLVDRLGAALGLGEAPSRGAVVAARIRIGTGDKGHGRVGRARGRTAQHQMLAQRSAVGVLEPNLEVRQRSKK